MQTVFIHTNAKQMLGAIVARHSLRRQSADPSAFDVRIISAEDDPIFREFEGKRFLRFGMWRPWRNDDLQSFTPLRFAPPKLMEYAGRAIVTDPDVFAVSDIAELFARDMQGCAICARPHVDQPGAARRIATSVMLLDCAKLRHWDMHAQFEAMFAGELDYGDWIELKREPEGSIGELEPWWNDFDRLAPETRLLHNTKRRTQPWKTGLPIDFTKRSPWYMRMLGISGYQKKGAYRPHPDPRQEQLFFAFLKECMDAGEVDRDMIAEEIARNHLRHDALELAARAPEVDAVLGEVRKAA